MIDNTEVMYFLIGAGVDLNIRDDEDLIALMYACCYGYIDISDFGNTNIKHYSGKFEYHICEI